MTRESAAKTLQSRQRRSKEFPRRIDVIGRKLFDPSDAAVFLGALASFAVVAADVFGSQPLHLLPHIDRAVHLWVVNHVVQELRQSLFEEWVSDLFIVPGLLAWPTLTAVSILRSPRKGAIAAGLAAAFYPCGGVALRGDVWLVDALKHFFHRLRPSAGHATFAFPSGHTAAAVFLTGVVLFVLLPAALPPMDGKNVEDGGVYRGKVRQCWPLVVYK